MTMTGGINSKSYIQLLEPWFKTAKKYIYQCKDRKELEYYGCGYNNWGVQTVQKALAAFAIASEDPDFNEARAGITKEELRKHAIKLLRFNLQSHIEGNYQCTDGTKWGHTWISALGTERMMHGIDAIYCHLDESDVEILSKVLESESNWLLDCYEIVAGLTENNCPDSNFWNGSLLLRTSHMFPELSRSNEYMEKACQFLINSISVPSDKNSDTVINGKPVKERLIRPQFFESYALNHHGYMNVGYMVIPLSNMAMLHFAYKKRGIKPLEVIYHHAADLWKQLKKMIFPDGRLLRIGGDSRVRYCYCQDYAIPMWLFLIDYLKDKDCLAFEKGWLQTVSKETLYNNDGSFLLRRLVDLKKKFPLYYTRLESDRAVTLSMGAYWRRIFDLPSSPSSTEKDEIEEHKKPLVIYANLRDESNPETLRANANPQDENDRKTLIQNTGWYDEYHGSCLQRGPRRITSFTWRACAYERPQGLCIPTHKSDMAEWWENMCGQIITYGRRNSQEIVEHKEHIFHGGFLTYGKTDVTCNEFLEGQGKATTAINRLVFAALPDDKTVIGMQYATSCIHNYYKLIKGVNLNIPNDLFNDNTRDYYYNGGSQSLRGPSGEERILKLDTDWLNIDNCLGILKVYGSDEITVYSPGRRQVGTHDTLRGPELGFLHVDQVCFPFVKESEGILPGSVLYDVGYIIRAGDTVAETARFASTCKKSILETNKNTCAMLVKGDDSIDYVLVFNITDKKERARIVLSPKSILSYADSDCSASLGQDNSQARNLHTHTIRTDDNGVFYIDLEPWTAKLLKVI